MHLCSQLGTLGHGSGGESSAQLARLALTQPGPSAKSNHALADDSEFFRQMADVLTSEYASDPERLYVTGFSNGAEMAHGLVARMSTTFAAAHLVAGTNTETALPVATRPMSAMYSTGVVTNTTTLPIDVDITVPPSVVPNMEARQVAMAHTVSLDPVRHAFASNQQGCRASGLSTTTRPTTASAPPQWPPATASPRC